MNRTAISWVLGYLLLSASCVACAQEDSVALVPQPYAAPAPPYVAPPPYATPIDAAELERRGQHKRVAGGVLMGLGAALTILGMALAIDVAANRQISCSGHEEHATCTPSPALTELQSGYVAAVGGQLLLLAGIPVYVVGSVQVARARRLAPQLAVQPLVSSAGGGAVASAGFRF